MLLSASTACTEGVLGLDGYDRPSQKDEVWSKTVRGGTKSLPSEHFTENESLAVASEDRFVIHVHLQLFKK